MGEFDRQGTVVGEVTAAMTRLRSVEAAIGAVRYHLSYARELAVEEHRPTDQIVALQHDLDALEQIVIEQTDVFLRKLAEVEARSRG